MLCFCTFKLYFKTQDWHKIEEGSFFKKERIDVQKNRRNLGKIVAISAREDNEEDQTISKAINEAISNQIAIKVL